jgi:hypothetical protein
MSHTKQQTRENTWKHAIRKRRIAREVLKWDYYNNLHQYSKNKIHCSCPLCRGESWSFGDNSIKQETIANQKKINDMDFQLKEILEAEENVF